MQKLRVGERISVFANVCFTDPTDFVQPEIKHKEHEIMLLYVAVVSGEYVRLTRIFRLVSIFFFL